MRQILESPSQLIHTTSRWSTLPIIKVNYPYSPELLDYVKEMLKSTTLALNTSAPTFKLSDEYANCKIYEYRVNMPHIVVKYRIA